MLRRRNRRPVRLQEPPRWSTAWWGPRVLVEHHDPAVRAAIAAGLSELGYDVRSCPGPDLGDRPGSWEATWSCPLLEGLGCPAVDGADAVVSGLVATPTEREIVRRLAETAPDRPLIVEGTPWMLRDLDEGLAEHALWPMVVDTVADRLAAAGRTGTDDP